MRSIILKISKVNRTIGKFHIPLPYFEIKAKLSFIDSIRSELYSKTMFHATVGASKVESIVIIKNSKARLVEEVFSCKQRLIQFV